MTIKDMEIFKNVVNCSNLTKVSKDMGLSQPNISMTIKSIESEFDEKLFDRISKKLILNERGRILYEKIIPLLSQMKDIQNDFSKNKISGSINIAATNTIGVYVLPILLYKYNKKFKDVKINDLYNEFVEITSLILNGKLDIGFIESEVVHPNIIKELLYKDELIVVSSDYNLSKKSYYIDQLLDKEWIIREKTSGVMNVFFEYLGDLESQLNVSLELEHTLAIKRILVKYRDTISILPEKSVAYEITNKRLYKINIINMKFERNCYIVYHKNKFKNAVFKSFKDYIVKNISEYDNFQ
ncbi:LysR substrate-binding domain-containing protein [Poseidonibacter antarcticus]|uniref:LysR substrate-binding domain-containing protein n=1 Tax=Poseidonibacter antarcticus TaxID=2478538 RepID=UPI000EF46B64|nr:LysR substrate-binding domain-containing protein [Poseidonibacter antarcticus]